MSKAVELCGGFPSWILDRGALPQVSDELLEVAGKVPGKSELDALLLLVAGERNYAGLNHLHLDSWAPGRMAILLRLGASIDARYDYEGTTVMHHLAAIWYLLE